MVVSLSLVLLNGLGGQEHPPLPGELCVPYRDTQMRGEGTDAYEGTSESLLANRVKFTFGARKILESCAQCFHSIHFPPTSLRSLVHSSGIPSVLRT